MIGVELPERPVEKFTLDNGLTLIVRQDSSAPVVSMQGWCETGSVHEGDWLGGGLSVVRVMPNQPALLRLGISGLYANDRTSEEQRRAANNIISTTGPVVSVATEDDIDIVTAKVLHK